MSCRAIISERRGGEEELGRRDLTLQHISVELSARPEKSHRAKTVHHRHLMEAETTQL